jgi:hypothetical protein
LLHSNYEETNLEELAHDVGYRPVDQTDAEKLACEADWRMIVESDKILSFPPFLIVSLTVREIPPQHPKQAARTRGSRLI